MGLPVAAIQRALQEDGLDGWLLYDFNGSNPIARRLSGLASSGKMTTRRWYYLVPAHGGPQGLVHAIERHNLDHLPGEKHAYAGRGELASGLRRLLGGMKRVAMEYSPGNAIPYVSRVDAGTVEAVRETGVEVVSSGDLAQRFEAVWSDEALTSHRRASDSLYRIKDRAFDLVRARLSDAAPLTEFDVQSAMLSWFEEEGLVSDATPNVSAQENAGNPHYHPSRDVHRPIRPGELLLLDLWGKLSTEGAVFADITWVAFTGNRVPRKVADVFGIVARARDRGVEFANAQFEAKSEVHGYEIDRAVRQVISDAGYGEQFVHRTGHSLGRSVHDVGPNIDDLETQDRRRLQDSVAFTIEPGIYLPEFGIRSEINVLIQNRRAVVTTLPLQTEVTALL